MSRRIAAYETGSHDFDDDGPPERATQAAPRRRTAPVTVLRDGARWSVVAKPAGLLTAPGRRPGPDPTVLDEVAQIWRRAGLDAQPVLCHRLDRDTSGCLLVAKDREAAAELMRAFRTRHVAKSYLALVTGAPHPPEGEIDFRVAPDRKRPGSMWTPPKGGKACHDSYETLECFRGVSLVRVRPHTGRTHEVRLAVRTLGTPCAIDPLYGTSEPLFLSTWKRGYRVGRGREERPLIDRLTLHAETLAFPEPGADPEDRDAWVRVEAPLPKDLETTLRQLRRHAAPGSL